MTIETARTPILLTEPKLSPTEMTSPGLIERSISRMIPAIRLPNVFCRPKPTARPKRAGEHRQRREVDAGKVDADEEGGDEDGDRGELLGEQLLGRVEAAAAPDRLADQPDGERTTA